MGDLGLVLWEDTNDYVSEFGRATVWLDKVKQQLDSEVECRGLDGLRFNGNRVPEAYLVADEYLLATQSEGKLEKDAALLLARKHGASGWWDLPALETWAMGRGPIVRAAMAGLGYVWENRRWKKTKDCRFTRDTRYFSHTTQEEDKRVQQLEKKLFSIPGGRRYLLEAGSDKMLYFSSQAETGEEAAKASWKNLDYGHIAKKQKCGTVSGINVCLVKEDAVYVRAVRKEDGKVNEWLFPAGIGICDLQTIANVLSQGEIVAASSK